MGESKNSYIDVQFNKKLKIGLKGSEVTSDGGLLAIREMDEKLGLTKIAGKYLEDNRYGKNIQHEMTGLLRQSIYSRLGGYEDKERPRHESGNRRACFRKSRSRRNNGRKIRERDIT
jgi:hypothetical protein